MKQKKAGLTVLGLAAALALIGGVYAYLTASDDETNTLLIGDNEIEIIENFDPNTEVEPGDNTYDKKIQVENTGNVDCYVRVYVGFTDGDAQASSGFMHEDEDGTEGTYYSALYEEKIISSPGQSEDADIRLPEEDDLVDLSSQTQSSQATSEWDPNDFEGGTLPWVLVKENQASSSDADSADSADPADSTDSTDTSDKDSIPGINSDLYIHHLPDGWVYLPEEKHIEENYSNAETATKVAINLGGWFYYTKPLAPGETTTALIDKVRTYFANEASVKKYDIIVYAESVQIKGIDGNRIETSSDADGNVLVPAWKAAWTDFLTRAFDQQIQSYVATPGEAAADSGDNDE